MQLKAALGYGLPVLSVPGSECEEAMFHVLTCRLNSPDVRRREPDKALNRTPILATGTGRAGCRPIGNGASSRDGGKNCSSRGNVRAAGGSAIKRDGNKELQNEREEKGVLEERGRRRKEKGTRNEREEEKVEENRNREREACISLRGCALDNGIGGHSPLLLGC